MTFHTTYPNRTGGRLWRRVVVALLATLTTMLTSVAAASAAAPPSAARPLPVHTLFDDPGYLVPAAVDCTTILGTCELWYEGHAQLSGTWVGTSQYWLHGHFNLDGSFPFVAHETFTGTVTGCGSGSMSYDIQGTVDGSYDLQAGGNHLHDTWKLAAGSTTSGLAGILRASGTQHGIVTNQVTGANHGEFLGTLWCK